MEPMGDRMRQRREQLDRSKADVARKVEVDVRTITRWESGDTVPDVKRAMQLAEVLECSLHWLLTGEHAHPPKREEQAAGEAA